jgi:ADP-heptose:LPS heptosyltransferase
MMADMVGEPGVRDAAAVDRQLGPVRRIAVFRALVLGDMVCATPALRALKHRFPGASLTLIGLPWARSWAARQTCIDDFIAFPGHPRLPESTVDEAAWPGFLDEVRSRRFDLMVQLHGSGGVTNGLVAQWGARHLAAFHEAGRPEPEVGLGTPWPQEGREPERLLRLVDGLGREQGREQQRDRETLAFPLLPQDEVEAHALLRTHSLMHDESVQPYVCLHPGAQMASRRWPVERFAQVGDALVQALPGLAVLITGIEKEALLAQQLQKAMRHPAIDLCGKTSLGSLGALVRGARLLVCNDTGLSHVAAALGTHSVVVSCGSDLARWSPRDTKRHAVVWRAPACRPCMHTVCPYGHECAHDIHAEEVIDHAMAHLTRHAHCPSTASLISQEP